ncbi:MAG: hypothetical protein IPP08_04875 [Chlorobiota bacterium]|jgi:hypothetical protein|nr:hypothetical protein [Chlorobiota bacterium]QQS67502.1 MAG: hypothetical protein IPP08_04875 [Chlorobiota bacterium]
MSKQDYKRFLLVKDYFYSNPDEVVNIANTSEFYKPNHVTGYRSKSVFHELGIKLKLEKILGIKIIRWDTDPIEENGVFYQGFSKGVKKEIPGVHSDEPYNDITVLIYLTKGMPIDCGTSLWMHKETKLINPPTTMDSKRLNLNINSIRDMLVKDSTNRSKWIEIDRVGNFFNRMVAYPSGAFHSATKHFGSNLENGRIYQTFRIGVNWDSFKMYNC